MRVQARRLFKDLCYVLLITCLLVLSGCIFQEPACGNGVIEEGETSETCCKDVGCKGSKECVENKCTGPVCGNDVLEGGETSQTCCKDAGCTGSQKCVDNKCIQPTCGSGQYLKDNECVEHEKTVLYPDKGLRGLVRSPAALDFSNVTQEINTQVVKKTDNNFISLSAKVYEHETVLLIFYIPENIMNQDIRSSKVHLKKVWCNRKNRIMVSSKTGYKGFKDYSNTGRNSFSCQKDNIAGFDRIGYDSIALDADIVDDQVKLVLQPIALTANNGEIPFEVDEIYLEIEYSP
ncbi:hypothetical protein ACFLRF_00040 [Candidatus Altiarchaeota archaeon]